MTLHILRASSRTAGPAPTTHACLYSAVEGVLFLARFFLLTDRVLLNGGLNCPITLQSHWSFAMYEKVCSQKFIQKFRPRRFVVLF